MISRDLVRLSAAARPLGEVVEFLDSRRRPVKQAERRPGPYPYYGANGQQGTIDGYLFDEPLVLLAEDGGFFGQPDRGVAYRISGRSWVNNHAHVLRPKDVMDVNFLCRVLENYDLTPFITGTTRGKLTKAGAEEILVPVPPVDQQRRIAAILDQADDLRRKRRTTLAALQGLTRIIFAEMFGDPIANSRGWTTCRFGEAGTLDRGVSKHRPRNAPILLGGPYPLIQTGDIANCDGYVRSYSATYSEHGLKQSKLWPAGTLCITIAANIGNTGVLTFDACFPDSVVGFTPNSTVRTEFVQHWLGFVQPSLEKEAPQFAQKNINLGILRSLKLPLPPISLQDGFAARVAEIDKLKAQHRAQLAKLDALFTSLQHRAFRGEL